MIQAAIATVSFAQELRTTRFDPPRWARAMPATPFSKTLDPDLELVNQCLAGKEAAWEELVRLHTRRVYSVCYRFTGTSEEAQDLTQEVFLRVFQGLPRFSLRCKFTTWLFQVTKNRVLDELRAKERRPLNPINLDDAPQLEVLDQPVERAEAIDALWHAIDGLPVDLKMALLLRDVVGLSYNEIADSLEVTLATVKWRIFKAREDVQLALAREGITFGAGADAQAL